MRLSTGSLLAAIVLASFSTPACAQPTKAVSASHERAEAHGKAGAVQLDSLIAALMAPGKQPVKTAAKPAPKAAVVKVAAKPKPVVMARVVRAPKPDFSARLRPANVLQVKDLPAAVDFLSVLPGDRFPLRALDAAGDTVDAKWRAGGGTLALGDHLAVWQAPLEPGVHTVTGTAIIHGRVYKRSLSMVVTVPTANVHNGKLNGYPIGKYPRGFGQQAAATVQVANRGVRDAYVVPAGFVQLTQALVDVPVSEHYKLGDFAGKDGWVGGKKYLFVEPRLVDKLERIIFTLHAEGYHAEKIQLMSAYRSPFLNADIGNETTLSRHTYGDAADMLVADFNGDGRVDRADADILMAVVTKLDKETTLTGGASVYRPNGAHGYFIHTDTRGQLVRW